MALPVNIHELINGRTVEWERIEFKKGWNPVRVLHTVCAFANDLNNWGGGYIIIGIGQKDGRPVLPPEGLPLARIDTIQQELLGLCHKLRPNYFPIVEPVDFQDKKILVIWVPGGPNRPYKAPTSLARGSNYLYYIRRYSRTKRASIEEERELVSMANQIPFDDQINQNTDITSLNFTLIQSHLAEVDSALLSESSDLPFSELCRRMNLAEGPDEYLKPKNVGLLLFNEYPERFFRGAQIDVVEFQDEVGDRFTEKTFTGPIPQQVKDALKYLKNVVISESVRKVPGQAEAVRFFNYPYEAIEESLVNAVYHRSYQDDSPVEVRVYPNRIEILSYPGPLPPLSKDNLMDENVTVRKYRNRRIGDFLKELHLTEGRSTGFPKIRRALEANGSPGPVFETDDERSYFRTVLEVHPLSQVLSQVASQVGEQVSEQVSEQVIRILEFCKTPKKRREILVHLGFSPVYLNYKRHIYPLVQDGWLSMTIPNNPKHRNQKYIITDLGLETINREGDKKRDKKVSKNVGKKKRRGGRK